MAKITAKPQSKRENLAPVMGVKRPVPMRPGMAKATPKAVPAVPEAAPSRPAPVGRKPGRPGQAAPAAAPVSNAEAESLRAELAKANDAIRKLTEAAAKAKNNGPLVRTREEIVKGISVPKSDWRHSLHGAIVGIKGWDRANDKNGTKQTKAFLTGAPSYPALLAIPRDSDGPWGAEARARGEIAIHFVTDENGNYVGEPVFCNQLELGGSAEDPEQYPGIWDDELSAELAETE